MTITTRKNVMIRAQCCLALVSEKYCRVGLKITTVRLKAIARSLDVQGLQVQGLDLGWVQVFHCLVDCTNVSLL